MGCLWCQRKRRLSKEKRDAERRVKILSISQSDLASVLPLPMPAPKSTFEGLTSPHTCGGEQRAQASVIAMELLGFILALSKENFLTTANSCSVIGLKTHSLGLNRSSFSPRCVTLDRWQLLGAQLLHLLTGPDGQLFLPPLLFPSPNGKSLPYSPGVTSPNPQTLRMKNDGRAPHYALSG